MELIKIEQNEINEEQELQKEAIGLFINKADLLNGRTYFVRGLTNVPHNFKDRTVKAIELSTEIDSDILLLQLNATNFNGLIDLLGTKVKDWKGVKIKIQSEQKTWDIKGEGSKQGYQLSFVKI